MHYKQTLLPNINPPQKLFIMTYTVISSLHLSYENKRKPSAGVEYLEVDGQMDGWVDGMGRKNSAHIPMRE